MHKSHRELLKDGIRKRVDFSQTGHICNTLYLAPVGKVSGRQDQDE